MACFFDQNLETPQAQETTYASSSLVPSRGLPNTVSL